MQQDGPAAKSGYSSQLRQMLGPRTAAAASVLVQTGAARCSLPGPGCLVTISGRPQTLLPLARDPSPAGTLPAQGPP